MSDVETWKQRVAEWKASGLKAASYCEGRDFSVQTLYGWSTRLNRHSAETGTAPVRVARVVLRKRRALSPAPPAAVSIEIQGARVVVPPGADRATVATVLEALGAWVTRGAR